MIKHIVLFHFMRLAFGENNSDLLIFKNGLQYHGEFLMIKNDIIYFKPEHSLDNQNVFTYQFDRVELKNREVHSFKVIKKINKTIAEEIDKTSKLVFKKGTKILEFDLGSFNLPSVCAFLVTSILSSIILTFTFGNSYFIGFTLSNFFISSQINFILFTNVLIFLVDLILHYYS